MKWNKKKTNLVTKKNQEKERKRKIKLNGREREKKARKKKRKFNSKQKLLLSKDRRKKTRKNKRLKNQKYKHAKCFRFFSIGISSNSAFYFSSKNSDSVFLFLLLFFIYSAIFYLSRHLSIAEIFGFGCQFSHLSNLPHPLMSPPHISSPLPPLRSLELQETIPPKS